MTLVRGVESGRPPSAWASIKKIVYCYQEWHWV